MKIAFPKQISVSQKGGAKTNRKPDAKPGAYLRVFQGEDAATSLQNQLKACQACVASRFPDVKKGDLQVFEDKRFEKTEVPCRDALGQLLDAVFQKTVDVVVVTGPERLSQHPKEATAITAFIECLGAKVVSASDRAA